MIVREQTHQDVSERSFDFSAIEVPVVKFCASSVRQGSFWILRGISICMLEDFQVICSLIASTEQTDACGADGEDVGGETVC